jgi:regulator of sirC expression with transglutaminase-like and TPR domain
MDRRRLLLCALGFSTACLGCVTQRNSVVPSPPDPSQVVTKNDVNLPKRNPKASTCVAFGNMRAGEATDEKLPETTRQQLQEQARAAYQQALSIDTSHVPAYLALANLYITEEDYPRALATYKKGLEKKPNDPQLWQALGMLHARKKEWEPALTALRKAVEMDPQDRQYTRTLGLCLARAGHTDESVASLSKVMSQAEAHLLVARMLHHLQRDEESLRYARLAVQEKPDLAGGREFLASLEHPGSARPGGAVIAGIDDGTPPSAN